MVNCTRSTVVTLVCLASLAYRLPVTVQRMIPPIFRGHCRRMIPSVANGQRFCYLSQLQQHFCHESYLILARTQLFYQLPLPKCPCTRDVNVCREPSGTVWLLWPFAHANFFCKQNYVGFKISWGQPSMKIASLTHEIFLPQKFPRLQYTHIKYMELINTSSHFTKLVGSFPHLLVMVAGFK